MRRCVAVRLRLDKGHQMLGVKHGFEGLIMGAIDDLEWAAVNGWVSLGGAELGTSRKIPGKDDFSAIARTIQKHNIEELLMIGGWAGYQAAYQIYSQRPNFPAFNIPIVCLPATIDKHLPGSN